MSEILGVAWEVVLKRTSLRAWVTMLAFMTATALAAQQRHPTRVHRAASGEHRPELRLMVPAGVRVAPQRFLVEAPPTLGLSPSDDLRPVRTIKGPRGTEFQRVQQYHRGIPVDGAVLTLHLENELVAKLSGTLIRGIEQPAEPRVSRNRALQVAHDWLRTQEKIATRLDARIPDAKATDPLAYVKRRELDAFVARNYVLAWRVDFIAPDGAVPLSVFVDAIAGDIATIRLREFQCESGSGLTTWFGVRGFATTFEASEGFLLRAACSSEHHATVEAIRPQGNAYADLDNDWGVSTRSGVTAYWGIRSALRYFGEVHARDSYDAMGGDVTIFNQSGCVLGLLPNNACWGGDAVTFGRGDTDSDTDDWNEIDIAGHELTHGVIEHSAGLIYEKQSGALNEAISDIFGVAIERFAHELDPLLSEHRTGGPLRSMADPKAFGQPDTYLGFNWIETADCVPDITNDVCGVHTNSGVMNRWFWLLVQGGLGINDALSFYQVSPIDFDRATQIVYRALTAYLSPISDYQAARAATLASADDLFCPFSDEFEAVARSWNAVNVAVQDLTKAHNLSVCDTPLPSGFYLADDTIATEQGCPTEVESGEQVRFVAGDRVVLLPGFVARSGSDFSAKIASCP